MFCRGHDAGRLRYSAYRAGLGVVKTPNNRLSVRLDERNGQGGYRGTWYVCRIETVKELAQTLGAIGVLLAGAYVVLIAGLFTYDWLRKRKK